MKRFIVIAAVLASFCLATSAEAGPLRRAARGAAKGGAAVVKILKKILPPYGR